MCAGLILVCQNWASKDFSQKICAAKPLGMCFFIRIQCETSLVMESHKYTNLQIATQKNHILFNGSSVPAGHLVARDRKEILY